MVRMDSGGVNAKPCNPAPFSPDFEPLDEGGAGPANPRRYSALDRVCLNLDLLLRAAARTGATQQRSTPGEDLPDPALGGADRRRSAGFMRVNHAGEVCAQALYVGQAVLARDDDTRGALLAAAEEEGDHLFWCEQRLAELDAQPSRLDPLWFLGSAAIGAVAALAGDRLSLGFVEETEEQVVRHLDGHLERLAPDDQRSRAIVTAMRADEARHAEEARQRGAAPVPAPLRRVMAWTARLMTTSAYWI
ncbi:MAG: 2-polyprenyl-3-methyl-6-methoxy-1,4-benzoquinone monooxygenase [Gammaproteobacteria bacterium]